MKYLFMLASINVTPITPPSLDDIKGSNFLDAIASFFEFIWTFLSNIASAIENFFNVLVEFNGYILELADNAAHGITGNLPILEVIGMYRFFVGDIFFYMTYICVLVGCLFTIYKLIILLIAYFGKMKESMMGGGKTSAGLLSFITKLFG